MGLEIKYYHDYDYSKILILKEHIVRISTVSSGRVQKELHKLLVPILASLFDIQSHTCL